MLWFDLQLCRTLTNKEVHSFVVVWIEECAGERPGLWVWIPGTGQGSGGDLTPCLCFPICQRGGLAYVSTYISPSSEMVNAGVWLSLPECRVQRASLWIAPALRGACIPQTLHKCVRSGDWTQCHACCSLTESRATLCDPMDCSTPGSSVLHCP